MAAEQAVQTLSKDTDVSELMTQWATFRLDKELFGVNVMLVQEVLRYSEITPVPGAPYFVLGIINLRGNVVTIIDTRSLFAMASVEVTDDTRIVIIELEQQVVGFLVDCVDEVVYVNKPEIEKAPNVGNDAKAQFISGVYHQNDELLILIDLADFLNTHAPATI